MSAVVFFTGAPYSAVAILICRVVGVLSGSPGDCCLTVALLLLQHMTASAYDCGGLDCYRDFMLYKRQQGRCQIKKNVGWTYVASDESQHITGVWGVAPCSVDLGAEPLSGMSGTKPSEAENSLDAQWQQKICRTLQTVESSSKPDRFPILLLPLPP